NATDTAKFGRYFRPNLLQPGSDNYLGKYAPAFTIFSFYKRDRGHAEKIDSGVVRLSSFILWSLVPLNTQSRKCETVLSGFR
ncbi:hypothetical protein WA026_022627, partial [Henosepilachna vigintioctopunctata]